MIRKWKVCHSKPPTNPFGFRSHWRWRRCTGPRPWGRPRWVSRSWIQISALFLESDFLLLLQYHPEGWITFICTEARLYASRMMKSDGVVKCFLDSLDCANSEITIPAGHGKAPLSKEGEKEGREGGCEEGREGERWLIIRINKEFQNTGRLFKASLQKSLHTGMS